MLIPNFSKDNFYLPDIAADSSPKRKMGNPFKSNSSIPIDDKNSKMYRKLQPITSNFFENINDINNKLNSIDTVRKHYYGDDSELSKKKIQQILKSENYFFKEDESQKNNKAMKYLYYANVGLSTSQSLMKAITSFLRANEKIYNVPDRCKNTQKLFLKDLMGKIMNDLKPADIESSKKFLQDDKKIEELIKKHYEEIQRINRFVKEKEKNVKNDLENFENIDLMHELRQKLLKEFKTPYKDLTSEQRKDKMIEIRNEFIPGKRKNLLESKINKQKELKKHEMTSKKSINNVYYQIISMNKKDREKFKKRIAVSSSNYSRFFNI